MKKKWQSYSDNGFKVPDAYFDTFASHLKDRQQLQALNGSKNEGFQIPSDYFKTIELRIKEHTKTSKVITLWWSDPRAITASLTAIAAVLVLLLLLWNPTTPQTNFESISSTSLNDYFEERDIQEFLTYEELAKIEENTSIFESISLTDEVIFDMIDNQVLNDDLEQFPVK